MVIAVRLYRIIPCNIRVQITARVSQLSVRTRTSSLSARRVSSLAARPGVI